MTKTKQPGELFAPLDTRGLSNDFFRFTQTDSEARREVGAELPEHEAAEASRFLDLCPDYIKSRINYARIKDRLRTMRLSFTAENLRTAWIWLKANGRVQREAVDSPGPDLNGLPDSEINETFEGLRTARRKRRAELERQFSTNKFST
jgi:hypothetical protein